MTGISTYGQALDLIDRVKTQQSQLNSLSLQLSTGKKAQRFSGLGNDLMTSKRARADFKSLDKYINNIDNAERRIDLMLIAIDEFKEQAENFASSLVEYSQEGINQEGELILYDDPATPGVNEADRVGYTEGDPKGDGVSVQSLAANLFDFMNDLLNTRDGDSFVLGGSEAQTQPIDNNGLLESAITNAIDNWKDEAAPGNITNAQLIADLWDGQSSPANPDAINDSVVGYNAQLTSGNVGKVFVRVNDTAEVDYTVLANERPFRDIMVGLAYMKSENLWPIVDVYNEPYTPGDPVATDPDTGRPLRGAPGADTDAMQRNFYEVFNAVAERVVQALDDIEDLRVDLENARVQIRETRAFHKTQQTTLNEIISDVEDADINEVAVQINAISTQLDASYRVSARIQQLSLVNFI